MIAFHVGRWFPGVLALGVGLATPTATPGPTGTVTGTVRDAAGAPVAGALEAGWEYYGAPLDRTTYFNHRLGATSLVSASLGVVVALTP